MNIAIRNVKEIKDSYGETMFPTRNKVVIRISRALNRLTATYAATLLHELLHVWVHVLSLRGFEMDDAVEHKFIYAAEKAVVVEFKKIAKKKGRSK